MEEYSQNYIMMNHEYYWFSEYNFLNPIFDRWFKKGNFISINETRNDFVKALDAYVKEQK